MENNRDAAFFNRIRGYVDVDLCGWSDTRRFAFESSRPEAVKLISEEDLLMMGTSLNDLTHVAMYISSSIAFRELITSMSGKFAMWAQTSRVNPLEQTKVSRYITLSDKLVNTIEEVRGSSLPQDQRRLALPLASLTGYTVQMSLRSWLLLVASLKVSYPVYYTSYGIPILDVLQGSILNGCDPNAIADYIDTRIPLKLKGYRNLEDDSCEAIGNLLHIKTIMPIALRAQLVRHSAVIRVSDLFWDESITVQELEELQLKDEIMVNVSLHRDLVEHTVIPSRVCWIAQNELWEKLLRTFCESDPWYASGNHTVESDTPCRGCYEECPYKYDNQARIDGNDPNSPCPLSQEPLQAKELVTKRYGENPTSAVAMMWRERFPV